MRHHTKLATCWIHEFLRVLQKKHTKHRNKSSSREWVNSTYVSFATATLMPHWNLSVQCGLNRIKSYLTNVENVLGETWSFWPISKSYSDISTFCSSAFETIGGIKQRKRTANRLKSSEVSFARTFKSQVRILQHLRFTWKNQLLS